MKSIQCITYLLLLGILLFSSCKKEETEAQPYSSITNLSQVLRLNLESAEYELVKSLVVEDGQLILNNINYNNETSVIELIKLNKEKELLWSMQYKKIGYSYEAVDITSAAGNYYLALNSKPLTREYSSAKIFLIDQGGNLVQEQEFGDSAAIHKTWANAINYDPLTSNPTLIFSCNTTDVDTLKPEFIHQSDNLDMHIMQLDLNLNTVGKSIHNNGNQKHTQRIFNLPDGVLICGFHKGNSSNRRNYFLLKLLREPTSSTLYYANSWEMNGFNSDLIDFVYDEKKQLIYLFTTNPEVAIANISKSTFDTDLESVANSEYIDLSMTEVIEYKSIYLLPDDTFLVSLEKSKNVTTENLEWIRLSTEGTIHSHYSFNDVNEEYIENIAAVRNANNTMINDVDLFFPVMYETQRNLGIYQVDLNNPNK
ncbi:MAG: hypothetical protein MK212_18355 [Saprospiraceae bacterium]|nr:hypothetical protein [Saprospiraceae bacterium]